MIFEVAAGERGCCDLESTQSLSVSAATLWVAEKPDHNQETFGLRHRQPSDWLAIVAADRRGVAMYADFQIRKRSLLPVHVRGVHVRDCGVGF